MNDLVTRQLEKILVLVLKGLKSARAEDSSGAASAIIGLGHIFREERAACFIRHLSSAVEEEQLEAEVFVRSLVANPNKHKLLQHIAQEVLFGNDRISLAAMAILAAHAQHDPSDDFSTRAARAVERLGDTDAIVFLLLFVTEDFRKPDKKLWRPNFLLDVGKLWESPVWSDAAQVVSMTQDVVFAAVAELKNRKMLLPEDATGQWGGPAIAPVRFAMSADTSRLFSVLHRALRLAEPDFARLQLGREGRAQEIWDRYCARHGAIDGHLTS